MLNTDFKKVDQTLKGDRRLKFRVKMGGLNMYRHVINQIYFHFDLYSYIIYIYI